MTEGSAETAQLGPSYDGTVMLDIGGDFGALVIITPPSMHLEEIEISPTVAPDGGSGAAWPSEHRTHSHGSVQHAHDDHPHDHAVDHAHRPRRTHVAVRERRGPNGVRYAAIYPSLPAGDYSIWGDDDMIIGSVTIVGGEVCQVDWR